MKTLCAQYAVELQFEDYVDGSVINHDALENTMRIAIQEALDKLQYLQGEGQGGRRNPLIMPMSVTLVKYETEYPHPDSLPTDMQTATPEQWVAFLRKVDELTLSEITDRAYVADRLEVHVESLDLRLTTEQINDLSTKIVKHVRSTC